MSTWKDNLKSYCTWIKFQKNIEFYHHFSSLFLFYAYQNEDTIAKQLEDFTYFTEAGFEMFISMIFYMISVEILIPYEMYQDDYKINFNFRCKVMLTPEEIQQAF